MSIDIKEAARTLLELGMMPLVLTAAEERGVVSEIADLVVSSMGTEDSILHTKHFLAFATRVSSVNFEFTLNCVGEVFLVEGMADLMTTLPEWKHWATIAWEHESVATC